MKKSEHLFLLIQSLSSNEKRYFRLFCGETQADSNYVRLFEAIQEQAVYDEAAIRQLFAGEPFLNQLHATKAYLRKLILKSLRNYHSTHSKEVTVKNCLINVEILFARELYPLCTSELRKAEKIATAYELSTSLVEIHAWHRKLVQAISPHDYEVMSQQVTAQKTAIEDLHNLQECWELTLSLARPNAGPHSESHPPLALKQGPGWARTLQAKVVYYHFRYSLHLKSREMDEAAQCLQELIELLETHPARIQEDPAIYLSTLNNLMGLLVYRKQYEPALAYLNRAREAATRFHIQVTNRKLIKVRLRTYNIELEIYRDTLKLDAINELMQEISTFIQKKDSFVPVSYLLSFWFQFAYIEFQQQRYPESLTWINAILNQKSELIRLDLQTHARLLNLIIHLELHNFFVLRYYVDSTRRFLKKRRKVSPYEEVLLAFFSRIGRIPVAEFDGAFRELYEHLGFNSTPIVPANVLDYIDLKSWILSKILPEA